MDPASPADTERLVIDEVTHDEICNDTDSLPNLTDGRDKPSAPKPETSRLIHLLTDPKPMEPSPDISKPKTVWCKSHVQQRSIEEEPPAEMEYKELNRSLPIYTPSIRRQHPRSRIRRRGCPYTTTTKG